MKQAWQNAGKEIKRGKERTEAAGTYVNILLTWKLQRFSSVVYVEKKRAYI